MLTKENRKIAEIIAEELAPNFGELSKLGEKFNKARAEEYQARERASAWQWKKTQESQEMAKNNLCKWREIRNRNYKEQEEKENTLIVARYNYTMALYDLAETFGEMVRPYFHQLRERQGLASLCEFINEKYKKTEKNEKGEPVAIWSPVNVALHLDYKTGFISDVCYWFGAFGFGACGLDASLDFYFKVREQEEKREPRERERLTVAQYCRKIKQLKANEEKARELEKEARRVGGDLLRYGFAKNWHIKED